MDNVTFTVHGVRQAKNDFDPPDAGREYLAIDVSAANGKDEAYLVSSFLMFKLQDSEGRAQQAISITDAQGTLDGPVAAGRMMRGELAFDVDASDDAWSLIIQPELFETDQAIFKIEAP
jgi:hypothetical protein